MTTPIHAYAAKEVGAPFPLSLEGCSRSPDGAVVIPAFRQLVAVIGMTRLRRHERLTGAELRFLRKAVGFDQARLARTIGATAADVTEHEGGPRPMTLAVEKCARMSLFNALRHMDGPRTEDMLDYVDWAFDEWRPRLQEAGGMAAVRLVHDGMGWREA